MTKIHLTIDESRNELVLIFGEHPNIIERLRHIFGAYHDSVMGIWRVPGTSFEDLVNEFGAAIVLDIPPEKLHAMLENIAGPNLGAIDLDVSKFFKIKPYDYQIVAGTSFLPVLKTAILADVPGLGKTLSALVGFTFLEKRGLAKKALIFCKKALKSQWLSEIERFTNYTAIKIEGDAENRYRLYQEALSDKYNFVLINYEYLQHDKKYVKGQTAKECYGYPDFEEIRSLAKICDVIILDEAQKIKNSTKVNRNMIKLDAPYKWLLTATPMENSPMDLFNLFRFMNPKVLGYNPIWFKQRYYKGRFYNEVKEELLEDLRRRIAPYMLRRTEGKFPETRLEVLYLDPSDDQLKIYEKLKELTQAALKEIPAELDGQPVNPSLIGNFALMLALADTPQLLASSKSELALQLYKKFIKKVPECPKLEWLYEFMEERQAIDFKSKTLIFSRSDRMCEIIKEKLLKLYPENDILIFHGGLNEKEQDSLKERFWGTAKVMLATEAGSAGLNLQCADVEINFDLPYNPSTLEQRIGRIKRTGSKHDSVRIINLITKQSMDERVLEVIYNKQAMIDQVINGNIYDIPLTNSVFRMLMEG